MSPVVTKGKKSDPITALSKNISHFKSVIRKVDIISKNTEKIICQNDTIIRAISSENNKRLNLLKENMSSLSTQEKLDKALEVIFANFEIINRSMETKSLLISDINEYSKRTRNALYALLKSSELLLEKQK